MDRWVLISVYDKEGIVNFAREIVWMGWKLMASGGTARKLRESGLEVLDVADLVGGDAILDHRVVTLSREIHAGLLADTNDPVQVAEMAALKLPIIEMLVCNFYPLGDEIFKPDATIESVVKMTDIGGPTMVRSAAKGNRIVICRSEDREQVLRELNICGDITSATRQRLRANAEFEVARYVTASAMFHGAGRFCGTIYMK